MPTYEYGFSRLYGDITFSPEAIEMIKEWGTKPGYHITKIPKGVLGEISKIEEELTELKDAAINQRCKIMSLVELSDLIGAIEAYLLKNYKDFSIADLCHMSAITKRAFDSGERK